MDLATIYSEDYELATDTSAWVTRYATLELGTGDKTYGKYIKVIQGGGSGPRSAYTKFYAKNIYGECNTYVIEFDAYIHYTHGNYDPNELIIYGEGARMPSSNAVFSDPNYIFKMTGGVNYGSTYTVENCGDSFTLNDAAWYHYLISVDKNSGTVSYTITDTNGNSTAFGSYTILDTSVKLNAQGIEIGLGRGWSHAGIDNIHIYRTDGAVFAFPELGTLTVTTSYPGCQPATATYSVTEYITPGDVNKDGQVNIVDVAVTISHIMGQEPENFVKAAADIDGNGTIDQADVKAIVGLIGWR